MQRPTVSSWLPQLAFNRFFEYRLPEPADLPESIHSRSVTLSSERLLVIAKIDLVEAEGGTVTPVDYKRGRPREGPQGLELWPSDRAQLGVQGIVLRENGYECGEGIVYYLKAGQRVRVQFDERADFRMPVSGAIRRASRSAPQRSLKIEYDTLGAIN